MKKNFTYNVDIVGTCNLRCPTCPIGNISHKSLPKGAMAPSLLFDIVKKAKKETRNPEFHLFNWTEPFLHPEIGSCIEVGRKENVPVFLSTNLNLSKKIQEVAEAAPDYIRVSLSGFNQESYGVTHAKGDIDIVKENMVLLSEAVSRNGSKTKLSVLFHRYLGNHHEEKSMREFAEKLNYEFQPVWAYLMPLEKTLEFATNGEDSPFLTSDDKSIIKKLALPLHEAIEISKNTYTKDCKLRSDQFTLDSRGDVALCCSVYQQDAIGNYLEEPLNELQKKKYQHPLCKTCMKNGLHVLSTYGAAEKFEDIAIKNVNRYYPNTKLAPTISKLTLTKLLRALLRRLF